ncbi:TetR/AcrR family transcriptional regulator [Salicibibacter cibi]|uniref:TetR/AcrR family transcriptional regulator n=1 Tax=Salicibibacter cibi TaxID=2743001 RepID=A0A7T7CF19_9BACI|nr:TetR/AcrR family transcriptional regulator [Salicibibacter cibi]QQK79514.1 TetR/AcrR family transcriptional regulator [Salicibibacter cibi]
MGRKYNPKQTKENIMATAVRLFMEKGYEKTSMQDIANTLEISKGGIYHHFNSKDEIINAVKENKASSVKESLNKWMGTVDAQSEREKLTAILEKNIADQEARAFDKVLSTQIKSPDFIVSIMKDSIENSAPVFSDIMKKGLADGSIATKYPVESAEVFFLLLNIYCDPVIFKADEEKLYQRLKFVQEIMRSIGADIVSDELIDETATLLHNLYSRDSDENE